MACYLAGHIPAELCRETELQPITASLKTTKISRDNNSSTEILLLALLL